MPLYTLDDFDRGLWLISGREAIPPNATRVATGLNSVHSKTARSRWGNKFDSATIGTPNSIFTFYTNLYWVTSAGGLYTTGGIEILSGLTQGPVCFVKAPPHFGANSYLFVCGGGTQIKLDSAGNYTYWGQPVPADNDTTAVQQTPAPVTVTIDLLEGQTTQVELGATTLSSDTTDYLIGTASLQLSTTAYNNGGFENDAYVTVAASGPAISQSGTTVTVTTTSGPPTAFTVGMTVTLYGYTGASGSIVPTGIIASTTTDTIVYTAASSATGTANGGTIVGTFANLDPSGSSDSDNFILYFQASQPEYFKALVIEFDLGSGFTTDRYSATVTAANLVATPTVVAPTDVTGMDQAASMMLGRRFDSIAPATTTQMGQQFVAQFKNYLVENFAKNTTRAQFVPTSGSTHVLTNLAAAIVPGDQQWWQILIPRGNFKRFGRNAAFSWSNVSGYRILVRNRHSTKAFVCHFTDFGFQGGVGMLGNYQYLFTWCNSNTGSYSNPNLTPTSITAVNRTGVVLDDFPVIAADGSITNVDSMIIWRTMGNGGNYYKVGTFALQAIAGSYGILGPITDNQSDYFGFGVPQLDWQVSTAYASNAQITPLTNANVSNAGNWIFQISTPGTSGSTEPDWSTAQLPNDTITDGTAEWFNTGIIGGTLSLEPLQQVNVQPASTITQAIYWNGTMFLCGDLASGARGRLYYSAPGFAEGVAGYTDITNDDDPTVGFGTYAGQLYLFTQKAMWAVVDVSVNATLPAFSAQQVQGAPGTLSARSIVTTPNALLYQDVNGNLSAFDGYYTETIAPQLLPILNDEAVEGYAAVGGIVAACFGNNEYWFSDGSGATFALNVIPSSIPGGSGISIRAHSSTPTTALYFAPEQGRVLAGWNGTNVYQMEVPSIFVDGLPGTAIPFALRTRSIYSGDKYTFLNDRILVDCNPNGNTLSLTVSLDGTDYAIGTLTGTSRSKFEFNFNKPGSLVGAYITGNLSSVSGLVEVFRVAFDANLAGEQDVNAKQ